MFVRMFEKGKRERGVTPSDSPGDSPGGSPVGGGFIGDRLEPFVPCGA
ncbi:hypothetical protein J7E95_40990 [Streptomyces sp. ISL-14]|nr:hypothetical protein [Streptomyces sp. ISL-14]